MPQFSPLTSHVSSPPAALHYNSALSIWLSVDPLSDKYPNLSPYVYCGNNPVRLVDPDGRTVVTEDEQSRSNIRNTLTINEAKYVKFNRNGVLNDRKLQRCKSTSENVSALKALSHSELEYHFRVAEKDHSGQKFYENSETNFNRGVTEMPCSEIDPSPDDNIYIIVGKYLSEEQQVKTTAHEGYGHGYIYEITRDPQKAVHTYITGSRIEWNERLKMETTVFYPIPSNEILETQINIVVKQSEHNYGTRKK